MKNLAHVEHGSHTASPEHYRCYQIYIPKTQGTRICDTVEFFPTHCKMPNVSAHDAAIYAANDLITALTKPQPTNSLISIGDDQTVALQKLATIFQTSITKQPISAPGVPDPPPPPPPPPPPQRPCARSQTKKFGNAALTTQQGTTPLQIQPKQLSEKKPEEDLFPKPPLDILHHNKPRIIPIIANLRPQYPTKHEGMLEDPFPLIKSANSVTDPNTGKQLEYKQLINHPDSTICQTGQRSSANEFGRLVQGVGGWIEGTETIKFLHYHEMPMNRRPTYAHFVCDIRPQKTKQERTRLTVGVISSIIQTPSPQEHAKMKRF